MEKNRKEEEEEGEEEEEATAKKTLKTLKRQQRSIEVFSRLRSCKLYSAGAESSGINSHCVFFKNIQNARQLSGARRRHCPFHGGRERGSLACTPQLAGHRCHSRVDFQWQWAQEVGCHHLDDL